MFGTVVLWAVDSRVLWVQVGTGDDDVSIKGEADLAVTGQE